MAAFLFTRQQISPEEDVENLGPYLKRVIWTLAGLAALFLGLRLYCKVWRQRSLFWDDYFLIASWVRAHEPHTPHCPLILKSPSAVCNSNAKARS